MKKFLVITGLALSLVSANAFAQSAKATAAQTAAKAARGAEATATATRAGQKAAKTVKLDTASKAAVGVGSTSINSSAPKAKLDTAARAQKPAAQANSGSSQLTQSARPAPEAAKTKEGAVCIGGVNYSSSCGSFTTPESISLVKQIIDTERNPSEIAITLAKVQGIEVSEARSKVANLLKSGCITKN